MAENIHDKGYKRLLSKKRNFLNMLKDFIGESWVGQISEEDLVLIDKEFILKDFKEKEADVIYSVKLKDADNTEVLFYCLIELQSSVDYTMPFRLLIYMVELLKRVFLDTDENIREQKDFKLPAVIPIVLYNGADNWTAVRSFKEYLSGHENFSNRVIDFDYILLSINQYADETLLQIGNLVSSVFMLDKKHKEDRLLQRLSKIAKVFSKLSPDEQIDLIDWIRDVLVKKAKVNDKGQVEDIIETFKMGDEADMTYAIERYLDEVEEKGIIKGKVEGKIEGKIDSIIEIIKRLHISLSEAMDIVKLPDMFKNDVISKLREQNIFYIE